MRNVNGIRSNAKARKGLALALIIILSLSALAAVLTACPIFGREVKSEQKKEAVSAEKTRLSTQQEKAPGDFAPGDFAPGDFAPGDFSSETENTEVVEVVEEVIGGEAVVVGDEVVE
ncbi:MAG: hypothetical protein AB1485_01985, partial [Candidatus Thermoplasmatota archaeon]